MLGPPILNILEIMDKLITETEIKSLLVQERYYHIWRGS